jgi:hypothetical protein
MYLTKTCHSAGFFRKELVMVSSLESHEFDILSVLTEIQERGAVAIPLLSEAV